LTVFTGHELQQLENAADLCRDEGRVTEAEKNERINKQLKVHNIVFIV